MLKELFEKAIPESYGVLGSGESLLHSSSVESVLMAARERIRERQIEAEVEMNPDMALAYKIALSELAFFMTEVSEEQINRTIK